MSNSNYSMYRKQKNNASGLHAFAQMDNQADMDSDSEEDYGYKDYSSDDDAMY